MTREDIIRMAREHHVNSEYTEFGWQEVNRYEFSLEELIDFAALVAAAQKEACAEFLMRGVNLAGLAGDPAMQKYTVELLVGLASAIRARGQNESR